jgi:hypothetical protein
MPPTRGFGDVLSTWESVANQKQTNTPLSSQRMTGLQANMSLGQLWSW